MSPKRRALPEAGIDVKIVTGDTPATAREIARQIGLWNDARDTDRNHMTGTEFAAMSDEELLGRVQELKIMSRARPLDNSGSCACCNSAARWWPSRATVRTTPRR